MLKGQGLVSWYGWALGPSSEEDDDEPEFARHGQRPLSFQPCGQSMAIAPSLHLPVLPFFATLVRAQSRSRVYLKSVTSSPTPGCGDKHLCGLF